MVISDLGCVDQSPWVVISGLGRVDRGPLVVISGLGESISDLDDHQWPWVGRSGALGGIQWP